MLGGTTCRYAPSRGPSRSQAGFFATGMPGGWRTALEGLFAVDALGKAVQASAYAEPVAAGVTVLLAWRENDGGEPGQRR